MFCPQCGTSQSDDLKFCKSCGANLFAVRQAVTTPGSGGKPTSESAQKFDWSKTWVAEMMLTGSERERQRGITPELRRHKEIKAGVITTSVGVGLAIFLAVFMEGIIAGGNVPNNAAQILSRLWVVGVIPFFVGLGLLINGLFVKGAGKVPAEPDTFESDAEPLVLSPGDAAQFKPSPSSVTEHTTRQLRDSDQK